MTINVKVPGKVHLIGEHAAVYGHPAILAAVGLYTEIKINEQKDFITYNNSSPQKISEIKDYAQDIEKLWQSCDSESNYNKLFEHQEKTPNSFKKLAIGTALNKLDLEISFNLQDFTEIPIGAGLGSSASFAIGITVAISKLAKINLSFEEINQIAFQIEKFTHGKVSGGDNATCCHGGFIHYQNKKITKLENINQNLEGFTLINTGKPNKTTGELVQAVRDLPQDFRNEKIQAIANLTSPLLKALETHRQEDLITIINQTHSYLSELRLSTKLMDDIHNKIASEGGGAKLCGAGGGGIMLCYHPKLKNIIKSYEVDSYSCELGVPSLLF